MANDETRALAVLAVVVVRIVVLAVVLAPVSFMSSKRY